jgi:predicted small metal-binding protein
MARKYIDCREHSDPENKCTVAISADSDDELLEAAVQHVIAVHSMEDSPDLRKELKTMLKEGSPRS